MIRHDRTLVRVSLALGLFALLPLAAARPAAAGENDGSYGYFRIVEGDATLMQAGGDREPAEINQPVLAGDRIWVPERSRVEVVLADRNILRLDGGSEVTLEQLAASPDRNDPATVIRLHDGNVLLTVTTYSLGEQLPRVDTPNASIYPQDFGTYRITASQETFTELVVRRGKAEVVTDRGSEIVRADESAFVEGDRYADVEIESAGSYDRLERWADELEGEARHADNDYLDEDLRYHAAPLARHGTWVSIEGRHYWRPRVDAGWRPYHHGRWRYTPAGLTWVSYESWGWVPYHYGSWDYYPSYGWVWEPGRRWAPAWVYWYWGPSYAGWCPTGYYTRFYRHRYPYFRYGVYGWAGGDWHGWSNWTFVRHDYFRGYRNGYRDGYKDGRWDGRRDHWDVRRYAVPVDELRRLGPLDRGVVTTDTRPLRPDTWEDPRRAIKVLTDHPTARRINGRDGSPELPDVTPFINRRPDLPTNVVRTVVPDDDGGQTAGRPRIAGRDDPRAPRAGVIPTDPSTDRPRIATRPRPGGDTPAQGTPRAPQETPGVRVPRSSNPDAGGGQPAERPRLGRPEPGAGGGAPRPQARPDAGDRGDRPQSRPEVRQEPRVQPRGGDDAGGTAPRMRRPESGDSGGAPRPQVRPEDRENDRGSQAPRSDSSPRVRRPESGDSGGAPRPSRPQVQPPPSYQDRDRDSGSTRQESPRTTERPRESERPRSYEAPRDREPSRPRVQPPPSSSRQPEASPSRPERREEARPSEPRRDNDSRRSASPSRPSRQGGGDNGGDRPRIRERKPPQG